MLLERRCKRVKGTYSLFIKHTEEKLAFNGILLSRLGAGMLRVLLEDYMGWVGSFLSSSAESLSLIGTAYQILQE